MPDSRKKRLGRGLDALIPKGLLDQAAPAGTQKPSDAAQAAEQPGSGILWVSPTELRPNPKQPRKQYDEDALAELADSIRRHGLQEPIVARKNSRGELEIVAGERRCRAAVMADVDKVPVFVRDVPDNDLLLLALIENLHRDDLNPIEQAEAYAALMRDFGWTQEKLAEEVGRSRVAVTNTLRLLNLPDPVRQMVADGTLSTGHAKALLGLDSPQAIVRLARKIQEEDLSVRQAEALVTAARQDRKKSPPKKSDRQTDPHLAGVEELLRQRFGTRVRVRAKQSGGGKIEIEYYDTDHMNRLIALLEGKTMDGASGKNDL
ncbi:MAG TPA: ParB/RepB/Spo0J family partition protein [Candidatus Hydrogenedentes bacterium]|nr:ParB/RepB/Spo0J family partition protein [Candidatus Hydrogenedentota bacterium]